MRKINFRLTMAFFIYLTIMVLVSTSGCSDPGSQNDEDKFIFPDSNISFTNHIEPLFQVRCGWESGCHSPTDINNPLPYNDLIFRTGLINHMLSSTGERLVDLSIHQKSPHLAPLYLILKEGYPRIYDDRMPPPRLNRLPLTDNQIEGIKQWIKEGAKD